MGPQYIDIPPPEYEHFIRYSHYRNEFEKVAKNNRIKVIYRWHQQKTGLGKENGNTWMGFLHGGLFHLYEIPNRFTDIRECLQAIAEGFPDCTCQQWLKLKDLGYTSQERVDAECGDYGYDQWIEIRSEGYETREEFDQDTGTGMERAEFDRIFEPFYTTKTGRRGVGLGLAIAKKFIEANNGRVEVDSRLGEGSLFTVRLPLSAPP